MTDQELIQAAIQAGYLNAATIKPAHLWHNEQRCPIVEIPEDAEMCTNRFGDLVFRVNGNENFKEVGHEIKWVGMIYSSKKKQWAEIITFHKKDLVGRYIKVIRDNLGGARTKYSIGSYLKVLENPATLNVCHTVELAGTLNLTGANNRVVKGDVELMPEGWDPSMLECSEQYKQLAIFPEEGVCWDPTDEFYDFISKKQDVYFNKPYKGIAWGRLSCWPVMQSSGKPVYTMKQLERFIPKTIPEHVKHYPLTPEESFFPKKWCIKTNEENAETLNAFLKEHSCEWHHYRKTWFIYGSGSYLHYPPVGGPCHSELRPQPGYTEITFEQFKKYVKNTHEDKQIINNNLILEKDGNTTAIKVQRSNLTIRECSEIRAVGLRCSKSKIKIGVERSSNQPRFGRG